MADQRQVGSLRKNPKDSYLCHNWVRECLLSTFFSLNKLMLSMVQCGVAPSCCHHHGLLETSHIQ